MEEVARKQGVERWAECTPDHLLYLDQIKRELPEAKVIHIVRDGRDVALSYVRQGWSRPLPWDRGKELLISGLYWAWVVGKGCADGHRIAPDYMEVHFEDLVSEPQTVLDEIAPFIGHELNYQRIQQAGIGTVSSPNTSFQADSKDAGFHPVGRWKDKIPAAELAKLEALIGDELQACGYSLATKPVQSPETARLRAVYPRYFEGKLWLKSHTPLRRLTSTALLEEGPN